MRSKVGFYYYRARYYSPILGRFISKDPIGFSGGINLYAYVRNNPVNLRDPLGLCEKCDLNALTKRCSNAFGTRGQRNQPDVYTLAQCAGVEYEQFGILCGNNLDCLAQTAIAINVRCGGQRDPDNKKGALTECTREVLDCESGVRSCIVHDGGTSLSPRCPVRPSDKGFRFDSPRVFSSNEPRSSRSQAA